MLCSLVRIVSLKHCKEMLLHMFDTREIKYSVLKIRKCIYNQDNFFTFLMEAVQMRDHHVCCYEDLQKQTVLV